ncbi:hypothetical protein D9615_010277 [Tricholomella constricta]|uniref:Uncharacterized protein n=1 Tax=Tricholomella constricta TaxID=117010 RepID=A0A8H5LS00_9AGAR|nr:hypothetical protein D9615_010277 [Tricholomella constricta]
MSTSQFVYIRVRQALLLPIPSTATNPPPARPQPPGHFYVIEGAFEDIKRYAGATVDWVIKVAHLICDPRGAGQMYTHTTGTPFDWYNSDRTFSWRQVVQGDPLLPGIYEFEPTGPILLSKISERNTHSVTTPGSKSSSATFDTHIRLRDGAKCVVTGLRNSLIASHLIPKRMGSDGAKAAVTRFSGAQAALDIHTFDPRIGILLFSPLDLLVDCYKLGFYNVTGNTYTLHNFDINDPDLSVLGVSSDAPILANTAIPTLHLYSVTLSVQDIIASLPSQGVF